MIEQIIKSVKEFWCVDDFKNQILDWKFTTDINQSNEFVIGHPTNSHKGASMGDILPYSRLPQVIKENTTNTVVKVPEWFWVFFRNNPFVDGVSNQLIKWGSLGTFGTSIQRTCNVWGFTSKYYTPKVYTTSEKHLNTIAVCVNSKTGGQIKDLAKFDNVLKELIPNFYITQIGTKDDPLLKNVHEYSFNISREYLSDYIGKFNYYIGVQNSIYHLAKAVGCKIVGILPENIDSRLVVLPFLTQINRLEIEMLPENQKYRIKKWKHKIANEFKIDPNESHHIGWLYPDSSHLTLQNQGTFFCPKFTSDNLIKALHDEIYPFNMSELWDYYQYPDLWSVI